MSLKDANRIARNHKRFNPTARVVVRLDRAACKAHNPNLHPMAGGYVVEIRTEGAARMVWE